jgi:hypothetical protein
MTDAPPPTVQIKQTENGTWDVIVSWLSGREEQRGNFPTEPEAKKWGQSYILEWLDSRKRR